MLLALQSAFGFIAICAIAWLLSKDCRAVPWRIVVAGKLAALMTGAAVGIISQA